MEKELNKLEQLRDLMITHGLDLFQGLSVIVVGLLLVRIVVRGLRRLLDRLFSDNRYSATATNGVGVLLGLVVAAAGVSAGAQIQSLMRLIVLIVLVVVGISVLLRPMVPGLPFKKGNTVKTGHLVGKMEGMTFISTRLRTFDGETSSFPTGRSSTT
jgi:small conductance mechanosensitive channel